MLEEKVLSFLQTNDPLERLNKAMALYRSTITSRYPPATIQEGKVDMGKALDVSLVVTESSETESKKQDTSSRSGNDVDADNADVRPIYDEEPMVEVQLIAKYNIFATRQQHIEQLEIITEDEATNKTQERDRSSKTSVMPSARFQSINDDSKPKPRSTNYSTRSLPVSKGSCVTKTAMPIADHSKNSNSFLDSKHFVCSTCQEDPDKDEEEDPEEVPKEEEIEDENMVNVEDVEGNEEDDAEVINPYEEADPHNRPPPTSDEETEAEDLSRQEAWVRGRIPTNLRFQEEPSIYTTLVPRVDDPYVMVRDAAMDNQWDEDVDTDTPWDTQPLGRVDPHVTHSSLGSSVASLF
nr:hypothetical protein [Tanacetum cinerariifolium]